MGLFQKKPATTGKPPIDETNDGIQRFFDGYFQELKVRGKAYFEKAVDENIAVFKQDLGATIAHANSELKDHLVQQLDEQFAENNKVMIDAQEAALQSIGKTTTAFEEQYKKLGTELQKDVVDQQTKLDKIFADNEAQIAAVQKSQAAALQSLVANVQALEQQQQQLSQTLAKNLEIQEQALITIFEENMARIIEQYLLGALGDQYDLKAQLPAIIKQMEANKQEIVDDMKL